MPSSDGNGAFVSAVQGKRFHFYNRCGTVTVSWPSRVAGVYNTELDNGQPVGLRRGNTVAEIDGRATSWHRTGVTLI
jgi:hypothetical protein